MLKLFGKYLLRYLPGHLGLSGACLCFCPGLYPHINARRIRLYTLVISTVAILLTLAEPLTWQLSVFIRLQMGEN